jgi:hypothetical protein
MSYDVDVRCPCCEASQGGENYTSNLSGAWDAAGAPLRDWHNKPVRECIPLLRDAIAKLTDEREAFRRFEPGNGWGNVEGATGFLRNILRHCEEFPGGKLSVDR